jgi:FG-GAP repeat
MRRFFATAVSIGLVGFCIAAHSSPLIIQPSQEFPYNEGSLGQGGWGGVALRGSFLFAGNSGGGQYPPVTGVVNIYRKVDDSQCSVSPCWVEESQLQRPDAVAGDEFGISIDFDGQTLVIGSPAFNTNAGTSSDIDYGAAYIYERDRDRFIFKQKLQGVPIPANPGGASHFGLTTVLSGDRLAITQLPEFVSGSAYVFKRNERGVWHQEAQLQPAAITLSDQFGISVDLTRDTLISGSDTTGYATLFYRKGDDWMEGPTLRAPDQAWNGGGGFGRSVTFHGDDKVAVGAYLSSDPNYVDYLGSEYLFKRDGKDWIQQTQIVDPDFAPNDDPMFGAQSQFRGGRLAIASTEGIYLYEHQDKQWVWVAKLVPPSPEYFVIDNSLDSLDLNATTVVATTVNGIAIFDISALDAKPAAAAP